MLRAPELEQVFACACSICSKVRPLLRLGCASRRERIKNGYLWAYLASSEHFVVVEGDENATLKSYEFGKRTMAHSAERQYSQRFRWPVNSDQRGLVS